MRTIACVGKKALVMLEWGGKHRKGKKEEKNIGAVNPLSSWGGPSYTSQDPSKEQKEKSS